MNNNNPNCENENDFKPFNSIDMETFIDKLKNEDQRNLHQVKSFKIIYLIFIFIYLLFFIIEFIDYGSIEGGLTQLLFAAAFIIFYFIFRNLHKVFRDLDYSVSLSEMLSKVIDRYQLKVKTYLQLSIPVLLINIALVNNIYPDLTWLSPVNRILIVQAFVIPIFVGAAYVGYLIWKKRQKPLVDNAKQLLSDLNAS
jgi:hypothetical protein